MSERYDIIIIGAGSAGMPAGIFAAERGARVLQIEADKRIGGTLYWSSGQMSAAGTRLQAAAGIDDSAEEHMIRPIGTPPFYAVRAVGFTVVSPAGVDVDANLRVLREDGSAIPNLYAAGEVLGFSRLSGNAFVGGMSLMPALTFGRLLGETILRWENGGA